MKVDSVRKKALYEKRKSAHILQPIATDAGYNKLEHNMPRTCSPRFAKYGVSGGCGLPAVPAYIGHAVEFGRNPGNCSAYYTLGRRSERAPRLVLLQVYIPCQGQPVKEG